MSVGYAIQQAVYTRLSGWAALDALLARHSDLPGPAIYDHVPQPRDASDNGLFPYVVIGDDSLEEWDTDDAVGYSATLTIHVWSRKEGRKETKDVMGAIYDALHRYDLPVSGYHTVLVSWESGETIVDTDGKTRQGIQRFRIVVHQ